MPIRFDIRHFALFIVLFAVEVFHRPLCSRPVCSPLLGRCDSGDTCLRVCKNLLFICGLESRIGRLFIRGSGGGRPVFHLVDLLGLSDCQVARVVIGTGFEWWDMVCYFTGGVLILLCEFIYRRASDGRLLRF